MAKPYATAVMAMLPQTPFLQNDTYEHESTSDLPVHKATRQQIFLPVAESQAFTRRDAAEVFDKDLLPAEERIPDPGLVVAMRAAHQGDGSERTFQEQRALWNAADAKRREEKAQRREQILQQKTQVVTNSRWQFKFQDISVDSAGPSGRDTKGIGMRYGVPAQDRKRGQIKIPQRVEA